MILKLTFQLGSGCLVRVRAGYLLLCFCRTLTVSHEQQASRVSVFGNRWVKWVLLAQNRHNDTMTM